MTPKAQTRERRERVKALFPEVSPSPRTWEGCHEHDISRILPCRPPIRGREDDDGDRADACARPTRAEGAELQVRTGLYRSDLPRSGHRAPRLQPRYMDDGPRRRPRAVGQPRPRCRRMRLRRGHGAVRQPRSRRSGGRHRRLCPRPRHPRRARVQRPGHGVLRRRTRCGVPASRFPDGRPACRSHCQQRGKPTPRRHPPPRARKRTPPPSARGLAPERGVADSRTPVGPAPLRGSRYHGGVARRPCGCCGILRRYGQAPEPHRSPPSESPGRPSSARHPAPAHGHRQGQGVLLLLRGKRTGTRRPGMGTAAVLAA